MLKPNYYVENVRQINTEMLKSMGITTIFFDIDNTLVPMYQKDMDIETKNYLENLKKVGFKIAIVSNARKKRVKRFVENYNILYIYKAGKPSNKWLERALDKTDSNPKETVLVGDQIFTDIYGANKLGMLSIYSYPLDKKELIHIRFKRLFEKVLFTLWKVNRGNTMTK